MAERSFTPRGFAAYAEFTDKYGSTVRVQESSLATDDCVWIFASHATPKLRPEWRERLAAAGFGTEEKLGELASFLTPSPHLNVEQAITVRDALDAFISEHQEVPGGR
jgi:predicted trehalose synthase